MDGYMELSEADFESVNAYHDGELDGHAVAVFEERLANEPALRAALEGVSEVSRALGALRPTLAVETAVSAPAQTAPVWRMVARIGIAASLVAVVLAGAGLLLPHVSGASPSPFERHRLFVAQDYPLAEASRVRPAAHWVGNAPDLSSARLTLVDAAGSIEDGFYFHYSGVNGCRLTFGVHAETPGMPAEEPGLLVRNWSVRQMHYTLFAVGMDRDRFDAIAAMLVQETDTGSSGNNSLMAVREATRTAVPCA